MSYNWRTLSSASDAGEAAGVYVLIDGDGNVIYVGQSSQPRHRLFGWRWKITAEGVNTAWGFYPYGVVKLRESRKFGDWLMIEARLIKRLKPARNIRMHAHSRTADNPDLNLQPDGSMLFDGTKLRLMKNHVVESVWNDPEVKLRWCRRTRRYLRYCPVDPSVLSSRTMDIPVNSHLFSSDSIRISQGLK